MKRFLSILLLAGALVCISACGSDIYRIIDTYSAEGSYVIAFRQGDKICDYVSAAMEELAYNGTFRAASLSWFGEDLIDMRGEAGTMDDLWEDMPERTVTVGVDISNRPMSYEAENGTYQGFDVDIADYICSYLGWNMVIYPIRMEDVDVELGSGNIDMAMGIFARDEDSNFSYSPVYLTGKYVLVSQTQGGIRSKSALRGKMLGAVLSDYDILLEDEKFMDSLGGVIFQTDTDGLFQALGCGEVDGILVSSVVAAYYMK